MVESSQQPTWPQDLLDAIAEFLPGSIGDVILQRAAGQKDIGPKAWSTSVRRPRLIDYLCRRAEIYLKYQDRGKFRVALERAAREAQAHVTQPLPRITERPERPSLAPDRRRERTSSSRRESDRPPRRERTSSSRREPDRSPRSAALGQVALKKIARGFGDEPPAQRVVDPYGSRRPPVSHRRNPAPALSQRLRLPVDPIASRRASRRKHKIDIITELDILTARTESLALAEEGGAGVLVRTRAATIVSELARNIFRYAGTGIIRLEVARDRLLIEAVDEGPGIPNLDQILAGNYRSETGMGMGIVGSRKLADEFTAESTPGSGTRITAVLKLT